MSDGGKKPVVITDGCGTKNPILTKENSLQKLNVKDATAITLLYKILQALKKSLNNLARLADLKWFARLDGTNQPFTGDLEIEKVTPELKLTDENESNLTRTSVDNEIKFTNEILYTPTGALRAIYTGSPTITTDGLYTVVKFTSSGTFVVQEGTANIEVLAIGGGGGGGARAGGGGGSGGLQYNAAFAASVQTYTVTVGAGGAGSTSNGVVGSSGSSSVFTGITATGGGGGGSNNAVNGAAGASGGGGSGTGAPGSGGTGTAGQGNDGGDNPATAPNYGSGGGGGTGAVGADGTGLVGGDGGVGTSNSITGSAVFYGGGGGGSTYNGGGTAGAGGNGGGGAGSVSTHGTAGTANTGGGGGGGGYSSGNGGAGGSGVVIVRYIEGVETSIVEVDVFKSTDSTTNGQAGTQTYGDSAGETVLEGTTIKAKGPLGYGVGTGGTVTQATNKSTGVTLSESCGEITMNGAALAASTTVSFVLTNTLIEATDTLILNHSSAGTAGSYTLNARAAAGSATIDVRNVSLGSLSEAIVIRFVLIKAVIT